MALRVVIPNRVRIAAVICTAVGVALLDESGAAGPLGWSGAALFCLGVALFEALDEGRLGSRQGGMILLLLGLGAATWGLMVILLTRFFLTDDPSFLPYLLFSGGLVAVTAGVRLRRGAARLLVWPRARAMAHRVRAAVARTEAA